MTDQNDLGGFLMTDIRLRLKRQERQFSDMYGADCFVVKELIPALFRELDDREHEKSPAVAPAGLKDQNFKKINYLTEEL